MLNNSMSTLTIVVTGTQISPLSTYNTYNVLHGGYLYDPMATPLSFFYPTSVFGGEVSSSFSQTITGGDLSIAYKDLSNNKLKNKGSYVFCNSEVIFDFSKFDQTTSKIIKLKFNPDNGYAEQTFNYYISSNQFFYPNLSSIKTEYYPSQNFYTFFNPEFTIYFEDGNVSNLIIPLTSIQCGIFDFYKNKKIIDTIPLYNSKSNTVLFVNDSENDEIALSNINTSLSFVDYFEEITLPFSSSSLLAKGISAIPLEEIKIANPIINENPVTPPIIVTEKDWFVTISEEIDINDISGEHIYPIQDI